IVVRTLPGALGPGRRSGRRGRLGQGLGVALGGRGHVAAFGARLRLAAAGLQDALTFGAALEWYRRHGIRSLCGPPQWPLRASRFWSCFTSLGVRLFFAAFFAASLADATRHTLARSRRRSSSGPS